VPDQQFDVVVLSLLPVKLALLAGALLLPASTDIARSPTTESLGKLEVQAIVAHGPWPVPMAPDPSNPVSGQLAAIEFGYRMFREPRMSANGYVTCIACHQMDRGFTDGIARAHALAPVDRNTPALANLRLQRQYGWLGSSDSLWKASLRPIMDAREFGSSAARVAEVVRIGDGLACRYEQTFGMVPAAHRDETVAINVAKALAAFQETLTTGRTRFDDFRDALARGDRAAAVRYPVAALRGARLFVGPGRCADCHAGPNFTDGALHSKLRTPSLRNVAVTAPYMHDGGAPTLREAMRQHSGVAPALPRLSASEMDELVAFLETLTDAQGAARTWPPLALSLCE
jgi:cytochrome c peroxidase